MIVCTWLGLSPLTAAKKRLPKIDPLGPNLCTLPRAVYSALDPTEAYNFVNGNYQSIPDSAALFVFICGRLTLEDTSLDLEQVEMGPDAQLAEYVAFDRCRKKSPDKTILIQVDMPRIIDNAPLLFEYYARLPITLPATTEEWVAMKFEVKELNGNNPPKAYYTLLASYGVWSASEDPDPATGDDDFHPWDDERSRGFRIPYAEAAMSTEELREAHSGAVAGSSVQDLDQRVATMAAIIRLNSPVLQQIRLEFALNQEESLAPQTGSFFSTEDGRVVLGEGQSSSGLEYIAVLDMRSDSEQMAHSVLAELRRNVSIMAPGGYRFMGVRQTMDFLNANSMHTLDNDDEFYIWNRRVLTSDEDRSQVVLTDLAATKGFIVVAPEGRLDAEELLKGRKFWDTAKRLEQFTGGDGKLATEVEGAPSDKRYLILGLMLALDQLPLMMLAVWDPAKRMETRADADEQFRVRHRYLKCPQFPYLSSVSTTLAEINASALANLEEHLKIELESESELDPNTEGKYGMRRGKVGGRNNLMCGGQYEQVYPSLEYEDQAADQGFGSRFRTTPAHPVLTGRDWDDIKDEGIRLAYVVHLREGKQKMPSTLVLGLGDLLVNEQAYQRFEFYEGDMTSMGANGSRIDVGLVELDWPDEDQKPRFDEEKLERAQNVSPSHEVHDKRYTAPLGEYLTIASIQARNAPLLFVRRINLSWTGADLPKDVATAEDILDRQWPPRPMELAKSKRIYQVFPFFTLVGEHKDNSVLRGAVSSVNRRICTELLRHIPSRTILVAESPRTFDRIRRLLQHLQGRVSLMGRPDRNTFKTRQLADAKVFVLTLRDDEQDYYLGDPERWSKARSFWTDERLQKVAQGLRLETPGPELDSNLLLLVYFTEKRTRPVGEVPVIILRVNNANSSTPVTIRRLINAIQEPGSSKVGEFTVYDVFEDTRFVKGAPEDKKVLLQALEAASANFGVLQAAMLMANRIATDWISDAFSRKTVKQQVAAAGQMPSAVADISTAFFGGKA